MAGSSHKTMKTEKPPFKTSEIPIIAELNALVYETFPPKWGKNQNCWLYGKLYYYDDHGLGGFYPDIIPMWYLDGMTPVGVRCVFEMLKERGKNVDKFEKALVAL